MDGTAAGRGRDGTPPSDLALVVGVPGERRAGRAKPEGFVSWSWGCIYLTFFLCSVN